MRDSLIFYSSFAKAIRRLPKEEQLKALWSIIDYGLDGKEPEEDGLYLIAYDMAKPQIDANIKRKNYGSKGGRPKTTGYKEEKPLVSENETTGYENEKPNVKDNVKEKVNVKDNKKYTCVFEALWKAYPRKKEKSLAYKAYQARLNDGFSEDELMIAVKRYAEECQRRKTEERYIKLGATFLGVNTPFTDYLKEDGDDAGREAKPAKKGYIQQAVEQGFDTEFDGF